MSRTITVRLQFHPATSDRWSDLVALFGERGACAGCWCMWWRVKRSEWEKRRGTGNKKGLKRIIDSGEVPGILAYADGDPVGWCSVSAREAFPVLERSRILARVDQKPVWSVVCFFIARPYRRKGVTVELLRAAVHYAQKRGAEVIEGYPHDPPKGEMADAFAYTGLESAFRKAGFVEVERRSKSRPIMRYESRR